MRKLRHGEAKVTQAVWEVEARKELVIEAPIRCKGLGYTSYVSSPKYSSLQP